VTVVLILPEKEKSQIPRTKAQTKLKSQGQKIQTATHDGFCPFLRFCFWDLMFGIRLGFGS
jgi:hypothetical protein